MPPNKLVKRSPSQKGISIDQPQRRSRGHIPSLRRPATSHKRSANLQQLRADTDVTGSGMRPSYSFEEPICPEDLLGVSPVVDGNAEGLLSRSWSSFLHSRARQLVAGYRPTARSGDSPGNTTKTISKRIFPKDNMQPTAGPHLVKADMISSSYVLSGSVATPHVEKETAGKRHQAGDILDSLDTPDGRSAARPKRSLSSTFAPAGSWLPKPPGSLRRSKRRDANHDATPSGSLEGKRHVSAPVRVWEPTVGRPQNTTNAAPTAPIQQGWAHSSAAMAPQAGPKRTSSSPLPPPSIVAGSGVDTSRRSPSGGAGARFSRPNQPSGSSTSSGAMSQFRGSHLHYEKSSAAGSFDGDARDLTSGDDYDTDFKSDTPFDSLRTMGSGRGRTIDTPLESVYDDSPPSTGGTKRSKRLSIQEMLDRTRDASDRISEEDENIVTPVRITQRISGNGAYHVSIGESRHVTGSSTIDTTVPIRDFGRFSLDDDLDEDWARDELDDIPVSALSPPSKESSLGAKGLDHNTRLALASMDSDELANVRVMPNTGHERPLSNLFDWSEAPTQDKLDSDGSAGRPNTSYMKQSAADPRGGRSSVRKGPTPTHIRSQSVPVVNETTDNFKPQGAKYGTWGLGTKTVSEDWDEDFEFAASSNTAGEKSSRDLFAVPESIRASQPSVKAHSGHIRELSLLVNDLKRLCRHGREMDMLSGDQKPYWKEAEGIIALASPDDDEIMGDAKSESTVYLDAFEDGGDTMSIEDSDDGMLGRLDAIVERSDTVMSKTAVVRERQSSKRRSVFSPEDDIFGSNWPLTDGSSRPHRQARPYTPDHKSPKSPDTNGIVRSVLGSMHERSYAERVSSDEHWMGQQNAKKMHFDTNSLKALVKRAGELRDVLSDMIRGVDQLTHSPARTPRHERRLESSPAFTRVFDDPGSSPPRHSVSKSRGSLKHAESNSPESSPPNIGRRVPLMTVS